MIRTTAVVACLCILAGCQSTSQSSQLTLAIDQYQRGEYQGSYDSAMTALRSTRGDERDEAAYLAGLAAYQMDRTVEAEVRWELAAEAKNPEIAANAKAMLGLIRMEQGRDGEAASLLHSASMHLSGDDAWQADRHAMIAERRQGGSTRSGTMAASGGPGTSAMDGCFTVQVGAFRERGRADSVAGQVAGLVAGQDFGSVKIVPHEDQRGRRLYLVQVGRFDTRQEAAKLLSSLGRREYIVVALGG